LLRPRLPGPANANITGDLNLNFQVPQTILGFSTPGDAAAVTDYWKTDEELRSEYVAIRTAMSGVEIKGLPITTASAEDVKRGADAMLARDPKSVILSIICRKDQVLRRSPELSAPGARASGDPTGFPDTPAQVRCQIVRSDEIRAQSRADRLFRQ
jgi:hypothetical protein